MSRAEKPVRIALVGPCAAGKSTLAPALEAAGYEVRQPTQEHSFVPDMWQRFSKPDLLIYLDLDYEAYLARRPHQDAGPAYLEEQHRRLRHARDWCDLYIDTSDLSAELVRHRVTEFLEELV